jgi:mannose-6-phosphate isomerase
MGRFFQTIMESAGERRRRIVGEVLSAMRLKHEPSPELGWMRRLHEHYPGDIGVLAPVLLNLVELKPGQALFLPAGELHGYLEGTGIELMANSDNVVRGGLTSKHIDVQELLNVLTFRTADIEILVPDRLPTGESLYRTPTEEFSLASISPTREQPFISKRDRNVEILLCTEGEANIQSIPDGLVTPLPKGNSVLVPAAVAQYSLEGNATVYRASVPTG